jgi:hypothetical protein
MRNTLLKILSSNFIKEVTKIQVHKIRVDLFLNKDFTMVLTTIYICKIEILSMNKQGQINMPFLIKNKHNLLLKIIRSLVKL